MKYKNEISLGMIPCHLQTHSKAYKQTRVLLQSTDIDLKMVKYGFEKQQQFSSCQYYVHF